MSYYYYFPYSFALFYLLYSKLEFNISINGIAKYVDYQMKDYLLIYNNNDKTINIYRGIDFEFVTKSPVINYNFIDFILSKRLDQILILVENNIIEKVNENDVKKSDAKYKILVLKDKENQLTWK